MRRRLATAATTAARRGGITENRDGTVLSYPSLEDDGQRRVVVRPEAVLGVDELRFDGFEVERKRESQQEEKRGSFVLGRFSFGSILFLCSLSAAFAPLLNPPPNAPPQPHQALQRARGIGASKSDARRPGGEGIGMARLERSRRRRLSPPFDFLVLTSRCFGVAASALTGAAAKERDWELDAAARRRASLPAAWRSRAARMVVPHVDLTVSDERRASEE